MAFGPTIRVENYRELQRAFSQLEKEVKAELRNELKHVAEPAREEAERLALANISNVGPKWSQIKLGVTTRGVYLVPKAHRRGGSPRSNLGGLLLKRSLLVAPELVAEPPSEMSHELLVSYIPSENRKTENHWVHILSFG